MSFNKRVSLPNLILFALEKFVEGGELVLESSQELKNWIYEVYNSEPRSIQNRTLSQAIRRLRLRGFLEEERKMVGKIVFRLTQKGKDFVLLSKEDDSEWDGRWRVVIFDIPESKRSVRDVLRTRLRNWGFTLWQKSVWASKKNVTEKLRQLIKELEIEDWVRVLESDNV